MDTQDNNETQIIQKSIENFTKQLESLYDTFPILNIILRAASLSTKSKFNEFIKKITKKNENDEDVISITPDSVSRLNKLIRKVENSDLAFEIIPRNFVVSLISLFDAFIGNIIRAIYTIQPERLNGSEKSLSFSKLLELGTIEEAREYLIEKEVESVLRESHTKQFKWLEDKISDVKLTGFPSWNTFIEITERRNLFVHCNGVVSSQYIAVCKQNKALLSEDLKFGDILNVDEDYFNKAYQCIFEIGIKLSQVIWRKLLPADIENADNSIISVIFDLIQRGDYQLAIDISELTMEKAFKHHNTDSKLVCIINKAQAHKWNGDNQTCSEIISSVDWSACSDKFKLAVAIMEDDYEKAFKIMRKIGENNGEVTKESYRDWPLFQELRKHDKFPLVFEEIFNEKFEALDMEDETFFGLLSLPKDK